MNRDRPQSDWRLIGWTLVLLIGWFGLQWLARQLTPPIPCNQALHGSSCPVTLTTERKMIDLLLPFLGLPLAGKLIVSALPRPQTAVAKLGMGVGALMSLYLVLQVILAVRQFFG